MIIVSTNAARKGAITAIGTYLGSSLSSGVTSVTFTGVKAGDFLVAMGGSHAATKPSYTAGWSEACFYTGTNSFGSRSGIIVTKVAESSTETVTFTGSGSSGTNYSAGLALTNVTAVGNVGTISSNAEPEITFPSPTLALQRTDGTSALLLASYFAGSTAIAAAPGSLTISNGIAYGLARSSWPAGDFTVNDSAGRSCAIVELVQ